MTLRNPIYAPVKGRWGNRSYEKLGLVGGRGYHVSLHMVP